MIGNILLSKVRKHQELVSDFLSVLLQKNTSEVGGK
jgi:hypothetical protein